jgi:type II secretory pathway component GspD/PulD (secretin)
MAVLALVLTLSLSGERRRAAWAQEGGGETAQGGGGGEKKGDEKKGEEKKDSAEPTITVAAAGVTVHAVNVYAHRLFARLAAKTGLQLVVDDAIKDRKVTVHLTDKTPRQIIDCIVSAYGFSSGEYNGILMISEGIPRRPSSYLLSNIESIPTQYVDANNAKSLLPVFLQDHVKVNPDQNAVVLSAPNDVLRKFRDDIHQFDIPAAQIMLEILVVELSDYDADLRDLGVRWQNAGRSVEFGTLPLPQDNTALVPRAMGEILVRGVADLPTEFRADLQALVSKRRARVRASPCIATVSGQKASFFVGIQRYLRQPIEMPATGENVFYGGSVTQNYIDAGVRLNVTPWTGDGKEIICDVRPCEVSTLSAPDPITGLPEKSTRTANTMVRVRDGQTIIIGGLRQDEEREVKTKVPLLGDLPLLGTLFRSRNKFWSHTDLVVFITPRVLSQTGHLSAEQEQQLRDKFLKEQ